MKPRTVTVNASIKWHRPPAEPVTEWPWRAPWGAKVGEFDDVAIACAGKWVAVTTLGTALPSLWKHLQWIADAAELQALAPREE